MKKIVALGLILVLALSLVGCSTAPQDEPETTNDTVNVSICGDFAATVRHLMPDYVEDDFTKNVAVVTMFQSTPFTVQVGELSEQLEVGKAYMFTVQAQDSIEITEAEYQDATNLDPEIAFSKYDLKIESVRLVEEGDDVTTSNLKFELND